MYLENNKWCIFAIDFELSLHATRGNLSSVFWYFFQVRTVESINDSFVSIGMFACWCTLSEQFSMWNEFFRRCFIWYDEVKFVSDARFQHLFIRSYQKCEYGFGMGWTLIDDLVNLPTVQARSPIECSLICRECINCTGIIFKSGFDRPCSMESDIWK